MTGFSCFFRVPPCKCRDNTLNYTTTASFQILSNSSFTYHPFIQRLGPIVSVTEKATLNKLDRHYYVIRVAGKASLNNLTMKTDKYCVYGK
jgi:hypothetical protein